VAESLFLRALRTPEGAIGAGLILAAMIASLAAPWLMPGDPLDMVARPLTAPFVNATVPLGTDRLGRSVAALVLHGAQASLVTALAVAAAALAVGFAVGALAGVIGGLVDEIAMRIADAIQTVPGFVIALAVVSVAGPSLAGLVAALAASAWTAPARVVRAEVLRLRSAAYVEASRLIGRSPVALAFQVLLPNAISIALALSTVIAAGAMLSEAALSFLGLGDPNRPSWGALIAEGRQLMRTHPHVIIAPGVALFLTVLAVALLGEGLSKALRARRS
jgi:peptide/nickel transport system permease protein